MELFVITADNMTTPAIVTISSTDITENWTKTPIIVPYPKSESLQDKNVPKNNYQVKVLDILSKMERRVTVYGHLATGVGASDTSANALDKARDLRNAFMAGGLVTISYYAGTFDGQPQNGINRAMIDKLEIKKKADDTPDNTSGVAEIDVIISFVIGSSMTSS